MAWPFILRGQYIDTTSLRVSGRNRMPPSSTRYFGKPMVISPEYPIHHGVAACRLMSSWKEPTYRFADGEYIRTGEDSDTTLWKGNVVLDEVPVLLSQDNGATWTPVGTVPRGCVAIAAEASTDELVLIMCTDGGMMSSSDRGNTWQQYLAPRLPNFDVFPDGLKVRYDQQKLKSTAPLPPVNVVN